MVERSKRDKSARESGKARKILSSTKREGIYTVCKRTRGLVSGGAVVRANEGVAEESQWKT